MYAEPEINPCPYCGRPMMYQQIGQRHSIECYHADCAARPIIVSYRGSRDSFIAAWNNCPNRAQGRAVARAIQAGTARIVATHVALRATTGAAS